MRKLIVSVLFGVLFLGGLSFAADFPDVAQHQSCAYCGMDRGKFAHSRMLIEYDDGTSFASCSLHCAAVNLATSIDKTPRTIQVGDYNGKKLIDAEKAYWVIGGKVQGVMTARAKWAFENRPDAERFAKENGGTVASFDEAAKAAYEDMYQDTKKIRERRKMKRMSAK